MLIVRKKTEQIKKVRIRVDTEKRGRKMTKGQQWREGEV